MCHYMRLSDYASLTANLCNLDCLDRLCVIM